MELWGFLGDVAAASRDPGRPKLSTTFDAARTARLSGLGPAYAEAAKKGVEIPRGERVTVLEEHGRGVLRRLCFTMFAVGRARLRGIRLLISWDGEDEPSVDVPLGDFFLQPFARRVDVDTFPISVNAGAFVSFFPMPFSSGFRIQIENAADVACPAFFAQAGWEELDRDVGPYRFHAHWHRSVPRLGEPLTFLDVCGAGRFVGASVQSQNLELWPLQHPRHWVAPSGLGLGQLEGWELLEADGELVHHGLAQEDWAGGAWYFGRSRAPAARHGVTTRSYLTGRCAFYRFYLDDAVPFRRSFTGRFEHGLLNAVPTDYAVTSYLYLKGAQPAASTRGRHRPLSRVLARRLPARAADVRRGHGAE